MADALPTTFVLFRWGANESDYGPVYLDEEGASQALADFGTRELMIDLEHRAIDEETLRVDPSARDAMGWAKLAIDPAIGLVARDVKWTAEGARRLTSKSQRFLSPCFETDDAARVVRIVNVALTSLPATRYADSLIAASAPRSRNPLQKRASQMDEATFIAFVRSLFGSAPDQPLEELAANISRNAPAEAPPVVEAAEEVVEESQLSQLSARITKLETERERDVLIADNRAKFSAKALAWARTAPIESVRAFALHARSAGGPETPMVPVSTPTHGLTPRQVERANARKIPLDRAASALGKAG